MNINDENWITVAKFQTLTEEVALEMKRWENVAEDMALYPQQNVRCIETKHDVLVQVSSTINQAFEGGLGLDVTQKTK